MSIYTRKKEKWRKRAINKQKPLLQFMREHKLNECKDNNGIYTLIIGG